MPNLTGEHARKPTDEKIAAKISEGDDEMPAFKDKLSPEQIRILCGSFGKNSKNGNVQKVQSPMFVCRELKVLRQKSKYRTSYLISCVS